MTGPTPTPSTLAAHRSRAPLAIAILCLTCSLAAAESAYSINPDTLSKFVGRTHAILVHFPIAMILVAAAIELAAALRDRLRSGGSPARVSPSSLTCMGFGVAGAIAASTAGWLNAASEGVGSSVEGTLFWHRWLGVSVAGIALVVAMSGLLARRSTQGNAISVYRAGLVVAALLVGLTGHLGGTMVYGDGYLIAAFEVPRPPTDPAPTAPPQDGGTRLASSPTASPIPPELAARITAIFENRCTECHGPRKHKGDLRLDTLERAAESESVLAGKPDESDLLQRLLLPDDDDDHMPKDDPSLPQEEIQAIRSWIAALGGVQIEPPPLAQGASNSAPKPPPVAAAPPPPVVLDLTPQQRADRQRAIDAVRSGGGYAAPISADSDLIHVNFAMLGKTCGDQTLNLLSGLEPVLYELNLSGAAVTDAGVKDLIKFPRLERLNLSRTAITDAGLRELSSLPHLASINLHNTAVTDVAVDVMSGMPSLRRAFLWRTGMTPEGIARLSQSRADLSVESGATIAAAPPPPQVAPVAPAPPPPAAAATEAAPEATVVARRPACCLKAESDGHECDHPCCVEARKAGKVCAKCLGSN